MHNADNKKLTTYLQVRSSLGEWTAKDGKKRAVIKEKTVETHNRYEARLYFVETIEPYKPPYQYVLYEKDVKSLVTALRLKGYTQTKAMFPDLKDWFDEN